MALTGARILTTAGSDAGAIDNGAIVITGDRLVAVGGAGGKAIMPGR